MRADLLAELTGVSEGEDIPSRFVVGIDLGTTNCAISFVDTEIEDWKVDTFRVPQWVDFGQLELRETLPSFHYQLTDNESLVGQLPWETTRKQGVAQATACVGVLARDAGQRSPGRRISSAKSWLSHDGVDRSADFLPWHGDADVGRLSPVTASAAYLTHLREAWNHDHPDALLEDQDVVITLPASFDEVARELTIKAAKYAGLSRVVLIEEPQAAFYAWIDRHRDRWASMVRPGQLILVCDIGGGTTDLTLIRVQPAGQKGDQVQFHRVAVGRHLILGGDNMDLAIAKLAESKLVSPDQESNGSEKTLSASQWDRLVQAARGVKETMLGESRPNQFTIHLAAEGSSLLAGAMQIELTADEIDEALLDGFFPAVQLIDRPAELQSGFQEFGLPYAADPAVTRHLAAFMQEHRRSGLRDDDQSSADRPDLVLFNGGVMASSAVRTRVIESLKGWFANAGEEWEPTVLSSPRLDLAVSQGAAYYAMVRRGKGVRIAANLGRSYSMQVSDSPPKAICLIPGSAEAGQKFRADSHPLELQVGMPVQFPLFVSSTRLADRVGDLVPIDPAEMSSLPPICTALVRGKKRDEENLNIVIESELTEIGTVGMYCVDTDSAKRWKLDFDIRSTLETDRNAHEGAGEAVGIVDDETIGVCNALIESTFSDRADTKPNRLVKQLQEATQSSRNGWQPSLLREMWQCLMDWEAGRRKSPQHESRWLNMAGFFLRPGYGVAVDDWRVQQTWRLIHGKLAHAASQSRTESLILWRRIAGGLTAGQQQQLAAPLIAALQGRGGKMAAHEADEVWRLVGALERLSVTDKVLLGELAIRELGRKKSKPLRPSLLWAIGRLGSRQPLYGPINTAISPRQVESWIDELLPMSLEQSGFPLALVQLARRTGDRFRDLSPDSRAQVGHALERLDAAAHYLTLVRDGGKLDREEEAAVFGDSLPLGIRLSRG